MRRRLSTAISIALFAVGVWTARADSPPTPSVDEILAASPPGDWRTIDPNDTLYLDLPGGRVVIELAPAFAPHAVANVKRLVRQRYFDGLSIVRVQDNYVVQWADPDGKRSLGGLAATLQPEFSRSIGADLNFTHLPDADTYAPETGFSAGFPAARDPMAGQTWLTHCYGMVGVGRDNATDSGNGAELYAVIGQAPRQLDRNVTLVGRVVRGVNLLSAMPRGTGPLGFYQTAAERIPILRVAIAADLPPSERAPLTALKTDSPTFAALVQVRRFRRDAWYKLAAGHVDVCNVPLPVRDAR